MFTLHISLVGRSDLTGEIYRQIRQAILDGKLKPDDRLPPTRVLATSLAVSRSTVTAAYERLLGDGLIASRVGSATFVTREAAGFRRSSRRSESRATLRPRSVWQTVPISGAFPDRVRFDFRIGIPDMTVFPHNAWRRAVRQALRSEEMSSGMYETPAGLPALREAIADHIGVSRAVVASAEDVIVTNGTQQALDIVARILLDPGDTVAVEDPGYGVARHLFRTLGAEVIGVPVDMEGMIVDRLPSNARLAYVTPSHQFPLGVSMSLSRRRALLDWAEHHNAVIVEDDYDSEFRFDGRPLEPLQMLDVSGRVIYIGTFSKTIFPALRMGFLVMPPSLRAAAEKAKFLTDWHSPTLVQSALARFISDGSFVRHLRKVSRLYRERRQLISDIIAAEFSDHLDLVPGSCGLHLAALAKKASVERIDSVAQRAATLGVAFQQIATFAATRHARAGITIGYGRIPTFLIREGLRRLRKSFA